MKAIRVYLLAALFMCVGSIACATPQRPNILRYGANSFAIFQVPMLGLWHYDEGKLPDGKTRPPSFDFTSTANWSGYSAEWGISGGKLLLLSINGRIKGKDVKDKAILSDMTFPVVATWFTGKIHLPVGDFNEDTQEYESVIVFDVDKGIVKSKTFFPSARLSYSWNGLVEP